MIEPFRIKTVEPIRKTSIEERQAILKKSGFNLFKVPADAIYIDLLTDSGSGAMSSQQWAAMMQADESYAGSKSFYRFEAAVRDIFGFTHILPTHQGRAAERILAATLCQPGDIVPSNTHFDTTRANIEVAGATALDLPCSESRDLAADGLFKGNIDLPALEHTFALNPARIPFVIMTITNNGGGGQPVSMDNLRLVSEICHRHGAALYIDACRFAENAYFVQQRTPEYANTSLIDIARQVFSYADGCTMSAKKDGMVNIGGFLCTNDDQVASRQQEVLILTEGFSTYGGLAGRDLEAIAVGLYEALDPDYQEYRHAQSAYLGQGLVRAGVPIVLPPGGHAIYIDARSMLSHIPPAQYPGQALAIEIYRRGGVRSVEIGSVMQGHRDPDTGEEILADKDLVRLAIPRRVYTRCHLDYVVDLMGEIRQQRQDIHGVSIVSQPARLRHFTAEFATLEVAASDKETVTVEGREITQPKVERMGAVAEA
jgi:tryptophanase